MPSPLLQLRIPQDLADWLEAKCPSRGEVAEYVRQLLTAEQMKEAVDPLVPEGEFLVHGVNCPKVRHFGNGDQHADDDDRPFIVDGVAYCGRCHGFYPDFGVSPPATNPKSKIVKDSPNARRGVSATSGDLAGSGGAASPSLIVKDSPDSPVRVEAVDWQIGDAATAESPSVLPPRSKRGRPAKVSAVAIERATLIAPVSCRCGGVIYQAGKRVGQCSRCSSPKEA